MFLLWVPRIHLKWPEVEDPWDIYGLGGVTLPTILSGWNQDHQWPRGPILPVPKHLLSPSITSVSIWSPICEGSWMYGMVTLGSGGKDLSYGSATWLVLPQFFSALCVFCGFIKSCDLNSLLWSVQHCSVCELLRFISGCPFKASCGHGGLLGGG